MLKLWAADQTRVGEAQALAVELARVNSAAALGSYAGGQHPSTLRSDSLHETFRGWNGAAQPKAA